MIEIPSGTYRRRDRLVGIMATRELFSPPVRPPRCPAEWNSLTFGRVQCWLLAGHEDHHHKWWPSRKRRRRQQMPTTWVARGMEHTTPFRIDESTNEGEKK